MTTTQYVCAICCYPSRDGAERCDNPGCVANPSVTQHQKDAWAAAKTKRDAEEAERSRFRGIHLRMVALRKKEAS